jgi:hypothetical protein
MYLYRVFGLYCVGFGGGQSDTFDDLTEKYGIYWRHDEQILEGGG